MIFVTVGTHEQPFNRLIQKVDELKHDGIMAALGTLQSLSLMHSAQTPM